MGHGFNMKYAKSPKNNDGNIICDKNGFGKNEKSTIHPDLKPDLDGNLWNEKNKNYFITEKIRKKSWTC
jgi:hypothetical protein